MLLLGSWRCCGQRRCSCRRWWLRRLGRKGGLRRELDSTVETAGPARHDCTHTRVTDDHVTIQSTFLALPCLIYARQILPRPPSPTRCAYAASGSPLYPTEGPSSGAVRPSSATPIYFMIQSTHRLPYHSHHRFDSTLVFRSFLHLHDPVSRRSVLSPLPHLCHQHPIPYPPRYVIRRFPSICAPSFPTPLWQAIGKLRARRRGDRFRDDQTRRFEVRRLREMCVKLFEGSRDTLGQRRWLGPMCGYFWGLEVMDEPWLGGI